MARHRRVACTYQGKEKVKTLLNGRTVEIEEGLSLQDLITAHRLKAGAVVISVNDRVVRPVEWNRTTINEGDCIELVSLVGGG
jgi:sulfur carrier protein